MLLVLPARRLLTGLTEQTINSLLFDFEKPEMVSFLGYQLVMFVDWGQNI